MNPSSLSTWAMPRRIFDDGMSTNGRSIRAQFADSGEHIGYRVGHHGGEGPFSHRG